MGGGHWASLSRTVPIISVGGGALGRLVQHIIPPIAVLFPDTLCRWGGRGGKMARIREQERAEAAKLREAQGLPPLPTAAEAAAGTSSPSSSSDDDSDSDDGRGSGKTKADKKGGKKTKAEKEGVAVLEPAAKKRLVVVLSIKEDPNRKVGEPRWVSPCLPLAWEDARLCMAGARDVNPGGNSLMCRFCVNFHSPPPPPEVRVQADASHRLVGRQVLCLGRCHGQHRG